MGTAHGTHGSTQTVAGEHNHGGTLMCYMCVSPSPSVMMSLFQTLAGLTTILC
jgi:hypothetical protein